MPARSQGHAERCTYQQLCQGAQGGSVDASMRSRVSPLAGSVRLAAGMRRPRLKRSGCQIASPDG